MPDSKRFLHPEAIRRIARLELRARHIVEGFLSGIHRSPYFGQSVEFLQHREYAPGDDLRHVDWKVWAKQDRYYVKQFEEDTNLRATLVVDVSARACSTARSAEQVRVRLDGRREPRLPASAAARRGRLRRLRRESSPHGPDPHTGSSFAIDHRRRSTPIGRRRRPTSPGMCCEPWPRKTPRRGLMIVISDLLVDRAGDAPRACGCCGSGGTT